MKTRFQGLLAVWAVVIMALSLPNSTSAIIVSNAWNGGTNNWNNTAFWSTGVFPNNTAGGVGTNYVVFIDGGNAVSSVVTDNVTPITINALNVDLNDRLVILNGATLTVNDGVSSSTITNKGRIMLTSASFSTCTLRIGNGTKLAGGGTISMTGPFSDSNNRILGVTSTAVLTNLDNTIDGSGNVGFGNMRLVNFGTIDANQSLPLYVELGSSIGIGINNSIMQASGGGYLGLYNCHSFDNTLGTIRALNTTTVELNNVYITGGVLTNAIGAMIRATGNALLIDITKFGILEVQSSANYISGSITNVGTISLVNTIAANSLYYEPGTALRGGGTISVGTNGNNVLLAQFTGTVLTNWDNIIQGAGKLGNNAGGLVNYGTIIADQPSTLTIDPYDFVPVGFVNSGTVQVNAGSLLNVSGPGFTNFVAATATLTGGTYRVSGALQFDKANVSNNAANIILDGPTSTIQSQAAHNALANFVTNTAAGSFTLQNGRVFSTAGPFVNLGTIQSLGGATFANFTNVVNGTFDCTVLPIINVNAASLNVTNSTSSALLEVRSGTFTMMNASVVRIDKLVITNSCGRFIKFDGVLSIGTTNLGAGLSAVGDSIPNGWKQQYHLDPFDPNLSNEDPDGDGLTNLQEFQAGTDPTNNASALAVTAITREGNSLRITWKMGSGKTNALERLPGTTGGSYSNNFTAIFTATNTVGSTTNYADIGAATNSSSRYYRVRLVP
jgi:hypothetical protein